MILIGSALLELWAHPDTDAAQRSIIGISLCVKHAPIECGDAPANELAVNAGTQIHTYAIYFKKIRTMPCERTLKIERFPRTGGQPEPCLGSY
jgi:hypothetical protein